MLEYSSISLKHQETQVDTQFSFVTGQFIPSITQWQVVAGNGAYNGARDSIRAVPPISRASCSRPRPPDSAAIWRNPRNEERRMNLTHSDALVFFGATGDLIYPPTLSTACNPFDSVSRDLVYNE
jgi:hypothetical protein